MSPKLQRDWAQIAHEYTEGATITELCLRHRLSRRTLYRRARQGGWLRGDRAEKEPMALIDHMLNRSVTRCLAAMEQQILANREMSFQDAERQVRVLAGLARLAEWRARFVRGKTLAEAEAGEKAARTGRRGGPQPYEDDGLDDADRFRQELIEHFQKLFAADQKAAAAQAETDERDDSAVDAGD